MMNGMILVALVVQIQTTTYPQASCVYRADSVYIGIFTGVVPSVWGLLLQVTFIVWGIILAPVHFIVLTGRGFFVGFSFIL